MKVNEQLGHVVLFSILSTVGTFEAMDESLVSEPKATEKYFRIPYLNAALLGSFNYKACG